MTKRRGGRLAAVLLVLPIPAGAADAVEIRHAAVECVPRDRYARLVASGQPAGTVAAADLQFRVAAGGAWYSIRMIAEDGEWSATLPRPIQPLERFEYRVVMRSADLQEAATAPVAVRVAEDPAECGGTASSAAVGAPIVVQVPAGAPVLPPVPPGFSPAGVVAFEEKRGISAATKWLAGAGLAAAIGGAVAVVAGSDPPPAISAPIVFAFFGVTPTPGSVIAVSRDRLVVTMRVTGGSRVPSTFIWDVELLAPGATPPCALMRGVGDLSAARPTLVLLAGALTVSGACGPSFDVDRARFLIVFEDAVVYDQVHFLPFHVEP